MSKHGWTERVMLSCGCDYDYAAFGGGPFYPGDGVTCPTGHGARTIKRTIRLNWTTHADVFAGARDRDRRVA